MATATIEKMAHQDWLAEGRRRFGDDFDNWRFVCPLCKHVASVGEFRAYRRAKPESATSECIGRYQGGRSAFGTEGTGPCDYAGYGLFRCSPIRIAVEGKERHCFAFAEPEPEDEDDAR